MLCLKCKNSCMGTCSVFGKMKTDKSIRESNFVCFKPRIHKINRTLNYFGVEDNIHLEEMTEKEIEMAIRDGHRVKELNSGNIGKNICL